MIADFAFGIVGGALLALAYVIGYRRAEAVCLRHQQRALEMQQRALVKLLEYEALIAVEKRS